MDLLSLRGDDASVDIEVTGGFVQMVVITSHVLVVWMIQHVTD